MAVAAAFGHKIPIMPINTLLSDLSNQMTMYVVYANPTDYPGKWVVRRWDVDIDHPGMLLVSAEPLAVCSSLQEAREAVLQKGDGVSGVCLPRHDADDPAIWETWV